MLEDEELAMVTFLGLVPLTHTRPKCAATCNCYRGLTPLSGDNWPYWAALGDDVPVVTVRVEPLKCLLEPLCHVGLLVALSGHDIVDVSLHWSLSVWPTPSRE